MKSKTCKRCGFTGDIFQVSAHDCVVRYPPTVQQELERLWFVFGNNGPQCTMGNHKFIQRHVEGKAHEAKFYKPTKECRLAVKHALSLVDKKARVT
jgi:hypothetical protein